MGFSIALRAWRPSSLPLGRHLRLLSGFGLLHGTTEWAYIFLSPGLDSGGWQTLRGSVLGGGHALLIATSFAFLFSFGSALFSSSKRIGGKWFPCLPWGIFLIWFYVFLSLLMGCTGSSQEWLTYAEIWSRYLLALPGAFLSSWALWEQRQEVRKLNEARIEHNLVGGALAFLLYTFAGGLVVPPANFFPAHTINTDLLIRLGLPVQVLRAVSGVMMAYFIIKVLDLYEVEARRELEEARRRELLWQERERIRRDIHDGVIQAIYSLGLGLDQGRRILHQGEINQLGNLLTELLRIVDNIIEELRSYLSGLDDIRIFSLDPFKLINQLLEDFTIISDKKPVFEWEGRGAPLSSSQAEHLYYMVKEVLSNVYRHADANKVEVNLKLAPIQLLLTIHDNGRGFNPEDFHGRGEGLANLRWRASLAGGMVDIKSRPGKGTTVQISLPYLSKKEERGN